MTCNRSLIDYTTPKILFTYCEKWTDKKDEILSEIKNLCDAYLLNNVWTQTSIEMKKSLDLKNLEIFEKLLYTKLIEFTHNKCDKWCKSMANLISIGINALVISLFKVNKYQDFTIDELNDLIFAYITEVLDDFNQCIIIIPDI